MQVTGILLVFLALPLFVVPWFRQLLERRRFDVVNLLEDHVVISGHTPFVHAFISEFESHDHTHLYVIVEPDRDHAVRLYESTLDDLEAEGKTTVLVGVEAAVVGVVATADTIKDDSYAPIETLHDRGIEIFNFRTTPRHSACSACRNLHPELVVSCTHDILYSDM